ncbi:hypothetical protein QF022_002817 [Vogesella perlucida]|nr:hypothetical protein [Vogesella perlucida]
MFRPLQKQAMTLLGKLKYFSKPPIIVYDPSSYKVKGADVRELLGVLQPGDILLRAYDGYLDSWFIRSSRPLGKGARRRGVFTHAALYVGRLGPQDRDRAAADISGYAWDQDRAIPAAELPAHREAMRERFFDSVLKADQAGNWPDNAMVIHAMAEGVQMEDILSFCRCDYLQVLRLPAQFQGVPHAELPPVFRLQADSEEARLAGSLLADQCLQREDATRLACAAALGKLGAEYDFACNDVKAFQSFSCAELVFYCYRAVGQWLDMRPRLHGFLGLWPRRVTVTPDDFTETRLETVWQSRSLRAQACLSEELVRQHSLRHLAEVFGVPETSLSLAVRFDELAADPVSDFKRNQFDIVDDDIRDVADKRLLKEMAQGKLVIQTVGDYCDHMVRCSRIHPEEVSFVLRLPR